MGPMGPQPPVPAVSPFFLTGGVCDAAMTYFHDRLFAAEPEISAMFPAAIDTQRRCLYAELHLPPAGHPGAVAGHLVIAEQRGRLGAHYLPDLSEHQADFLFGARVGARFDRVPQRPDVRGPDQAGRYPVRGEPAHERGLVLLLMHGHAVVVQPEMVGHPELESLHLGEESRGALHQLGVFPRPSGEPERQFIEPDEPQRLLRDGRSRTVPDHLVGEDTADVMQHEREADVLEHRPVAAAQDVFQVLDLIFADPADVRVQAGLPGAVAHLAGELGEVLRVVVELIAVQSLQPAVPADLAQVGGYRLVVDLGPRDQEHFGLNVAHTRHPTPWLAAGRGTR